MHGGGGGEGGGTGCGGLKEGKGSHVVGEFVETDVAVPVLVHVVQESLDL